MGYSQENLRRLRHMNVIVSDVDHAAQIVIELCKYTGKKTQQHIRPKEVVLWATGKRVLDAVHMNMIISHTGHFGRICLTVSATPGVSATVPGSWLGAPCAPFAFNPSSAAFAFSIGYTHRLYQAVFSAVGGSIWLLPRRPLGS